METNVPRASARVWLRWVLPSAIAALVAGGTWVGLGTLAHVRADHADSHARAGRLETQQGQVREIINWINAQVRAGGTAPISPMPAPPVLTDAAASDPIASKTSSQGEEPVP